MFCGSEGEKHIIRTAVGKHLRSVMAWPVKVGAFFYGFASGLVFGLATELLSRLVTQPAAQMPSLLIRLVGPLVLGSSGATLLVASGRVDARSQAVRELIERELPEDIYQLKKTELDTRYARQTWTWIIVALLSGVVGLGLTRCGYAESEGWTLAYGDELRSYLSPVTRSRWWDQRLGVSERVVSRQSQLNSLLKGKGTADFVAASPVLVAQSSDSNLDLRILGSAILGQRGGATLFALSESGLRSPEDLKEGVIGVSSLQATSTIVCREVLSEAFGIAYDEVSYIVVPPEALIHKLEAEEADAGLVSSWKPGAPSLGEEFIPLFDVYEVGEGLFDQRFPLVTLAAPNSYSLEPQAVKLIMKRLERLAEESQQQMDGQPRFELRSGVSDNADRAGITLILTLAHRQGVLDRVPGEEIFYGSQ